MVRRPDLNVLGALAALRVITRDEAVAIVELCRQRDADHLVPYNVDIAIEMAESWFADNMGNVPE